MTIAKILFPLAAVLALTPWISSGEALLMGVLLAVIFGNPFLDRTKKMTHTLLGLAVMGLGAGMDLAVVGRVGVQGIGYTIAGIGSTMIFGTLLGRWLGVAKDTSLLVTVGTAICGGSAIAAVSPVIQAKHHEVSVSLGIVFMLNAAALFIFPALGHHFSLDEGQFGLWGALAIHDTSSVVGATLQYGAHALQVGTTVKLARALWIVPVAFGIGWWRSRGQGNAQSADTKGKKPWFILGFIIVAALVTWIPELREPGHYVELGAKRVLVLTLFLIGSNLTRETIKSVGVKPFIQGFLLWIIMGSLSLGAVIAGWIHL